MSPKQESCNKRGSTLIELLISIGVLGIISVVFVAILSTQQTNYLEQTKRNALATNAQSIIRPIQSFSRGGSSVIASTTISQGTFTTDVDTLVLQIPAILANGSVVVNEYDILVLERVPATQKNLRFIISPNAQSARTPQDRILSTLIEDFVIRYATENVALATFVDITFGLQEQYKNRTIHETYSFFMALRNSI